MCLVYFYKSSTYSSYDNTVFANTKTGLQRLDKRKNESKRKRHKRSGKEKTGSLTETQSISAVKKATPWVVFENVSSILKHTVIFGLLGAGKDLSFQCKNLEMIMFAWSHALGSAKPHSYPNYLHLYFEKQKAHQLR